MECQWFSSRYHCSQWFFNGFFTSEPSLMMVFHISTIGINGFSNGFPLETMVFQWFFTVEPLVSMVFYRWTIGINGLSNGYINWSKNLVISWKSYRYHQYPKYIPSYLEPLLALLGDGQAWTPNIYLKSFDMDSVQVGKAVFVKESYTTLGIEPRTFINLYR